MSEAIEFVCGHCGTTASVDGPLWSRASNPPTTNDLVMAGANYCSRCRQCLCRICGTKNPDEINADCVRKDFPA